MRLFLLFFVLALAPTFSRAGDTYVGNTGTTIGNEQTHGLFELKVNGSKISGRVYSPALSHGFRVYGSVNKAGRISIRALNQAAKGRILGKLRRTSGKIQAEGSLVTIGQLSAKVTIKGAIKRRLQTFDPDNLTGVYIMTPEDRWDSSLYSYVELHIEKKEAGIYHWDTYFAGKPGDHSDNVYGDMRMTNWQEGLRSSFDYKGTHVEDAVIPNNAPMKFHAYLREQKGRLGGNLDIWQDGDWTHPGSRDLLPHSNYVIDLH